MTMPSSKLATLFYALAVAHLLYLAYGIAAYYGGASGDDAFVYAQFRVSNVIFSLVNPAFCVLAGMLAQTVKNASDFMAEQVERRDFEQGSSGA